MSLSDLPLPSDASEGQDLEQDLEQALDDEHYPAEETRQVQSVSGSNESQEEPNPTFSSEEPTAQPRFPSATPHPSTNRTESQSPQTLSVAQTSPAPSVMFTPTPAFPPRPRPRFFAPGLPSTPAIATEHSELDNKDLTTPYARRRSFLIDVINSTARPRFAQPTPLPPRTAYPTVLDEEGDSASPDSSSQPSDKKSTVEQPLTLDTTVKLNAAFPGFTPGPRQRARTVGRLSHPLSRGWTASGSESEDVGGGASFTSTASSHDLTAHPRANASFDHVMGLGAGGHGIGRFNAGKLNAYLHGLNRRLQEESESLTGQVGILRKENVMLAEANAALQEEMERLHQQMLTGGAGSRRSSTGRRLSDIGSTLGGVREDAGGEGWGEEKLEMERELDAIGAELHDCRREREEAITALEAERAERSRDKERWRERMVEVERGVESIIHDLEAKVEKAEAVARESSEKDRLLRELEQTLGRVEEEAEIARTRAESAEKTLESHGELGGKLLEANRKLDKSTAALHDLQSHVERLEDELAEADQHLQDEQLRAKSLQDDLDTKDSRLEDLGRKLSAQEAKLQDSSREMQDAKAYITELEADAGLALDHIEALQQEIQDAGEKVIMDDGAVAAIKQESERNVELVTQLEDALNAAEQKMRADGDVLTELRSRIATLERERDRDRAEKSRSVDRNAELEEAEDQIEILERELDNAHREVSRLNSELAQSPARKALDRARDAKIELLEKEKEDLQELLNSLKHENASWNSPGRFSNASGISPIHRQVLNMTLKTPKTPGAPLRDVSIYSPLSFQPTHSCIV
jgi:chromosome segregation ATPase